MISLDSRVVFADGVLVTALAGEVVLLCGESGQCFALDASGTRAIELLRERGSLRRTLEAMLEEYDVGADVLEADILRLADGMLANGLLKLGPV